MSLKAVPAPEIPLALVESNPSKQAHIDLREIVTPKWDNPREPVKPEHVKGLAATMERFGLLQPVVVMPVALEDGKKELSGGYYLLAGHRRVAAARVLGWRTIAAHVLARAAGATDSLEHLAGAVALVENGQREDLDPLRDCEVVEHLLQEEGATLESVAAELGRPKSWVARRARLTGLCERARKLAKGDGPISQWPAAWLELLALLPEEEQVILAESQGPKSRAAQVTTSSMLSGLVRARLKRLGMAPWDLADSGLDPVAGACTACPKRTGAQADLFDAPRKSTLTEDQCLDSACWAHKLASWKAQAIDSAKEKHGPELVLLREVEFRRPAIQGLEGPERYDVEDLDREIENELPDEKAPKEPKGMPKTVDSLQAQPAKKGDKGAVPALVVEGKDAGKLRYVRLGKPDKNGAVARAPRGESERPPAKPKSMNEKRKALEDLRGRYVVEGLRANVDRWAAGTLPQALLDLLEKPDKLLDLVGAWGTAPASEFLQEAGGDRRSFEDGELRLALISQAKKRNGRILNGLISSWCQVLGARTFGESWLQLGQAQPYLSEAEAILAATGQKALLAELRAEALAAKPEPKSWGGKGKVAAASKAKAKAPAGKKRKPSGKDAASGEREED